MANGSMTEAITLLYAEKPMPPLALLAASKIGDIPLQLKGDPNVAKDFQPSLVFADGYVKRPIDVLDRSDLNLHSERSNMFFFPRILDHLYSFKSRFHFLEIFSLVCL